MAEHLTGLTAAEGFCVTMETSVRWELRGGSSGGPLSTKGWSLVCLWEDHALKPFLILFIKLLLTNFHLTWQLLETAESCVVLCSIKAAISIQMELQNGL